jgi:TolA-binding protein
VKFFRRTVLILFALILGGGQLYAEGKKEQQAYASAVAAFQDGMWNRAEMEFTNFVARFPGSTNVPQAVLLQAQAQFKQGKLDESIALLNRRKAGAGNYADQYIYWIGEAQFQKKDFPAAAATFVSLSHDFPGSSLRLRAVVEAAAALAQSTNSPRVIALLEEPGGVFQRAARTDSTNELVARGHLFLAQAKFAQKDFAGATASLDRINSKVLPSQLDWQRAYLLSQVELATGNLDAALTATTNLMRIAGLEPAGVRRAQSTAFHAMVLENLGRTDEAIAAYGENLATNSPVALQREAILKIAELQIVRGQLTNAAQSLADFLERFPESLKADIALLTEGELHLKNFAASAGAATNELSAAWSRFDLLLGGGTNGPLAGKAFLDRGWCKWLAKDLVGSLADFQAAAALLPPSEDLAVARFKIGDALFAQKDFAMALENYHAVLENFADYPAVAGSLAAPALYQSLRACLELNNLACASNALARIVKDYPAGGLAPGAALLYGESLTDVGQPAVARALFQQFLAQFPDTPLRPQVEMAVARTYEREQNWPAAIGGYESWLKNYSTNESVAQARYALAWAYFQADDETNAFKGFTDFVARHPMDTNAPLAQWWIADHYFRAGEFIAAETNYERIYQDPNWSSSSLVYESKLMAGHAAAARQGYFEAIRDYFSKMELDTNCPENLRVQATFAHGAALMRMDSTDTNNPLANFQSAAKLYGRICQMYPTNELGARAWGELGNCELQLTNYDLATNAYGQVFANPDLPANISLRSQAQIGFGVALEGKAALAAGEDKKALLRLALDNYLDVFETGYGKNLRDGETADPWWIKYAGSRAAPLIGMLDDTAAEKKFYQRLAKLLPSLGDLAEKKIAALPPEKN